MISTANILLIFLIICFLFQLFYYIYFFAKLSFFKNHKKYFNEPISIIICAKNELDNLTKNLPKILEQKYSKFEVIVVNDQSVDGTDLLLKELKKKYNNLVVVNIDDHIKHREGKKFALTLGIKTANNEYLLLTDADCQPNSCYWADQICSGFDGSDIILGFGGYQKRKGMLNKIIRFDTFNVAQQYLSYALSGLTYMGVGRNIAYKKSIFFKNKGFASHLHVPSGDDDLFIQEIAVSKNVSINVSLDSHTTSEVTIFWKDWCYQKRRHLTTGPLYKRKFKLLLVFYPLSQFLFWILIFTVFYLKIFPFFVILILISKLFTSYIVNYKAMKRLNVLDLYLIHPLYEIIHLIIQVIFVLLNLSKKPKNWS